MSQLSLLPIEKKLSIEDKIKLQERALSKIPYIPFDKQNKRDSMPLLLDHQVENCHKAEVRFWEQNEKAMMFTDDTGTGKTITGLSIVKTAQRRGINDVLIIVPTDSVARVWITDGRLFGLSILQLETIKDAGRIGTIVVTTYANYRQNKALIERARVKPFGLVLYDESHKLITNQQGADTDALAAHKQVTYSMIYSKIVDRPRWKELYKQTKVVFLSATPFSYHKNLIYADGYLFTICDDKDTAEERKKAYQEFFVKRFGYRILNGKLTEPDASVDVGKLERDFHTWLTEKGCISSTRIKLDMDYSREFFLVDDSLGFMIDEGYRVASDMNQFMVLPQVIQRRFSYLLTSQLLECIKAKLVIDRVNMHLAMGRKVVIFHSFNNSLPKHPFRFDDDSLFAGLDKGVAKREIEMFNKKYPQYINLDLSGLKSPIQTFKEAFPTAVYFNGEVPAPKRVHAKTLFNKDGSGIDLIVCQTDAAKEGNSFHDTTGKHQRVLINLGLPIKPADASQTEGRIYRIGQMSNAIVEYPVTHLLFEKVTFAQKINERIKTVENLAWGLQARNLKETFKEGYKNPITTNPHDGQGIGGRERDFQYDSINSWEMAKDMYRARADRDEKTVRKEGADYVATPEPLGMKIAEWLCAHGGEKLLEPSAGHGAIARFFPDNTENKFMEINYSLKGDLSINTFGYILPGKFEELNKINKFDGIAMFSSLDEHTAWVHLNKSIVHTAERSRIIVIVPHTMDTVAYLNHTMSNNRYMHLIAKMSLPPCVFERAGNAKTVLFIMDRHEVSNYRGNPDDVQTHDFGKITDIDTFFEEIKDVTVPKRASVQRDLAPVQKPIEIRKLSDRCEVVSTYHTKNMYQIWVVKLNTTLRQREFTQVNKVAESLKGRFSKYHDDRVPQGFLFRNPAQAQQLKNYINALH